MLRVIRRAAIGLALWASLNSAQGSISLNGTRLVFNAREVEASLVVHNQGEQEVLVQSWLDAGDVALSAGMFAITPPLVRLPAAGKQQLRVLYQGQGLPDDRESVFWINVQEIPQKAASRNVLQFAVRQRIKLFFRPEKLTGSAQEAAASLLWHLHDGALSVQNPTGFHISFAALKVQGEGYQGVLEESFMVRPGATLAVALKRIPASVPLRLQFEAINDFGGLDGYQARLDHQAPVQAHLKTVTDP